MRIPSWLSHETAQDSLEYLVAVAVIVVPVAAALIYGLSLLLPEVATFICPAIDSAGVGACF
jgi:hypothetical protein